MILIWITFLTAIAISAVAAWFSVLGLTQIFAAAFLPVAIMGGVLELGKVVAAIWTHHYWKELNFLTKSLLVPIIGLLMVVTSLGIFGLLSKGHAEQEMPVKIVEQRVASFDTQIEFSKTKIDSLQQRLQTLNEAMKKYVELGAVSKGLDKTSEDSSALENQIQEELDKIQRLEESKLKERLSISGLEAELGPIKYVAVLLGNDKNLEAAVLIVIFIIIFCFDPLALLLVILSVDSIYGRKKNLLDPNKYSKLKAIEIAQKELGLKRYQVEKMTKEGIIGLINNAR
tara:strand:- start:1642 stop:2499 length:858 start_codon:yes stop_codon:yes gene_type:complete